MELRGSKIGVFLCIFEPLLQQCYALPCYTVMNCCLTLCYMPLRIALFIDNYDFMNTCVQYLRLNNVRLCNSTYDTLTVCPSFSTPAVFVRHFPVLQIPPLHFCPSFSSPAFSCPANSVAPLMLNVKSSENCADQKVLGSGVRKSFDFYCKRHIYTWIHVV